MPYPRDPDLPEDGNPGSWTAANEAAVRRAEDDRDRQPWTEKDTQADRDRRTANRAAWWFDTGAA